MAAYQYVYHMDNLSKAYPGGKKCFENIRLNFLSTMPGIQMLDPNTGNVLNINVPIDPGTGRKLWDVTLAGGDAALFKFNDGAPFVGTPEPSSSMLLFALVALCVRRRRRRCA